MKPLKISLCFFIILCLSACSAGEFRNLVSFTDAYNKFSVNKLSLSDFIFDQADKTYSAIVDSSVILNLKEGNDGKIHTCRVLIDKSNNISNQHKTDFTQVLKYTVMAFCDCDKDTAEKIILDFSLQDYETFLKQGELTLMKDNFCFIYYSNEISSEVRIINTYLQKIEVTEKPVSKPYYGEDFIEKE